MTVARRDFLKAGTMMGICAALPLSAIEALAGQQRQVEQPGFNASEKTALDATESLTKAMFAAHLNTQFRVQVGDSQAVQMKLIKVSDVLPSSSAISLETSRQECFSIVFSAPRERLLSQNTYRIEHSGIGQFDLFIVPAGEDEHEKRYEAIFNRLRPYNLRRYLDLRRFGR